jgi:hypothetical protein
MIDGVGDCFTAGGASLPPAALPGLRPVARSSGLALLVHQNAFRLGAARVLIDGVGDQRSPEGEAPGSPE